MRRWLDGWPLRRQLVAVIALGAIVPFAIVAAWFTTNGVRTGQSLLRDQLDQSAGQVALAMKARWEFRRGDLLLLAGNEVTSRLARGLSISRADSQYLVGLSVAVRATIPEYEVLNARGDTIWRGLADSTPAGRAGATARQRASEFTVDYPVSGGASLRATIAMASVAARDEARPVVPGAHIGVRRASGRVLVPLDSSLTFTTEERIEIHGTTWLAASRSLVEPPLEVVVAAPLDPYVSAARDAGRVGLVGVVIVAALAFGLATWATSRVIGPLDTLGASARALSAGDLDRHVEVNGPREVQELASAFNVMTSSLRATLDQLAQSSASAAVGEFGAALAHDVRNGLTAIKVDLERSTMRRLGADEQAALLSRALNNLRRLESLVSGALRLAKPGHAAVDDVELGAVLQAAAEMARAVFEAVPATLRVETTRAAVHILGDATALQQLFANVFFNAAQAVHSGGMTTATVESDQARVLVTVTDDGPGMDPHQLEQLSKPFYTSKAGGTGLGLRIARQIASSHGGELTIESVASRGTTVRFSMPLRGVAPKALQR